MFLYKIKASKFFDIMHTNKLVVIVFGIFLLFSQGVFSQNSQQSELSALLEKQGYTPVELMKLPTGHLCVKTEVNDSMALFILDTGAGATVLDPRNESRFHLQTSVSGNKAVGAGGSNLTLKEGVIKNLTIQGYSVLDFNIHLMNLDHINNAFKKAGIPEVDGVIGADLLTAGKAIIDYTNLILYLAK